MLLESKVGCKSFRVHHLSLVMSCPGTHPIVQLSLYSPPGITKKKDKILRFRKKEKSLARSITACKCTTIDYRCAGEKNCQEVSFGPLDTFSLPFSEYPNHHLWTANRSAKKKMHSKIPRLECRLKLSNSKSGCEVAFPHWLLN
jgi:hypothetical protein